MCGIYGVINRKVRREQAMECLDTMIHRGPDGFGLWQEDGVTLGHRRLAILDLSSAGSQPMSYANERYWMTFNGEIYNFIEIPGGIAAQGIHVPRKQRFGSDYGGVLRVEGKMCGPL